VAAFDYRGPVAAGIAAAKLRGARSGWPPLAAPLAARLLEREVVVDAVTFVTTPRVRTRERGGDHAAVLARVVARALGLPAVRLLDAVAGADGDRYRAVRVLPGSDLLLIDDVVTTGATAWRAAAALRRAGAGRITLAVLARAGTHPLGAAQR
jgi:predicted amidophosphoribosyltransferase